MSEKTPNPMVDNSRGGNGENQLRKRTAWLRNIDLSALKIALIYVLIGGLWILFSDRLAQLIALDRNMQTTIEIGKGWVYVIVTALLLYFLICRYSTALVRKEMRYASIFEGASDGIFISTLQGKITYANARGCSMLGYTRDELLAKPMVDFIVNGAAVVASIPFGELRAGKTFMVEQQLIRKDGSVLPAEISAKVLEDGSLQGIVRDVTERKRSEEVVRESESRFQSLFEESPISLWEEDFSAVKPRLEALRQQGVIDLPAYFAEHPEIVGECARLVKVTNVNKAALQTLHADQKEDLLKDLDLLVEDEGGQGFQSELVNIASGKTQFELEGYNTTLDGKQIYVNLSWAAMPGYEETLSKVIVSMLDITERKQAEEALISSEAQVSPSLRVGERRHFDPGFRDGRHCRCQSIPDQVAGAHARANHRSQDLGIGVLQGYRGQPGQVHGIAAEGICPLRKPATGKCRWATKKCGVRQQRLYGGLSQGNPMQHSRYHGTEAVGRGNPATSRRAGNAICKRPGPGAVIVPQGNCPGAHRPDGLQIGLASYHHPPVSSGK